MFFLFFTLRIFSQNQYAWIQKAPLPAQGRHGSLGLTIGNRGYMGLGHVASPGLVVYKDWFEYDAGTDSWTQKADFGGGGRDYACGFGIGNYGYVGTGQDTSVNVHDDWWRYDPASNVWTLIGLVPDGPRDAASAFAINGKGYVCADIFLGETWEFDPSNNSWNQKAYFPGGTTYVGCCAVLNGKGYLGLTYYFGVNDWYEYDPTIDVWTQKASMPGLPRSGSLCFGLNGFVFCGTGTDWGGNNFDDMYSYNPTTDAWTAVVPFAGIPRHLLASFVLNNHLYCGTGTSGTNFNDFWEYGTISEVNELTKSKILVSVFPNPATTEVTISITNNNVTKAKLNVYDALQNLVLQEDNLKGNLFHVNCSGLKSGNYFFNIVDEKHKVISGQFSVQ